MKGIPAAQLLVEFDRGSGTAAPSPSGLLETVVLCSPVDVTAARQESYETGFAEGRTAALGEIDAKLQTQEKGFVKDLISAREAWVAEQSSVLGAKIEEGLRSLEERLSNYTAEVLAPVLGVALRQQVVEEFTKELKRYLGGDDGHCLEISGPDDLLQQVRQALSDTAGAVSFQTNDDQFEIRVTLGQKTIESNLAAWLNYIQEAMK